jgi:NADH-quinone oxidoreductase subunit E
VSVVVKTEKPFAFTAENDTWAKGQIAKYPAGRERSAILALLTRAQEQNGDWLNQEALEYVGAYLKLPFIRVLEVATFYSMYNLRPVGKHLIEICTTTPCWLRGSADIVKACEEELGISIGETTPDGQFTIREAECLGACVNAPMCMLHKKYYEDLTPESMKKILRELKAGKTPKAGPQIARQTSAPVGGPTVLKEMAKA